MNIKILFCKIIFTEHKFVFGGNGYKILHGIALSQGCIDGFFGKKEYAAIPETKFITKLQQLLCLVYSIWHIFLRKPLNHLQILLQHVSLKVFCQKAPGFLSFWHSFSAL